MSITSFDHFLATQIIIDENKRGVMSQLSCFYSKATLSPRHIDVIPLTDTVRKQLKSQAMQSMRVWLDKNRDDQWLDLNAVVFFIGQIIKYMPAMIEHTFFVDGAGCTYPHTGLHRSTEWVSVTGDLWVRLSEARTADHQSGVLRSEIDGSGFALEATKDPHSLDPRDCVTWYVFQPEKEEDKNYPWLQPRDAAVFDLRSYQDAPYYVGPLYNGFPNQVKEADQLKLIMMGVRALITEIVY